MCQYIDINAFYIYLFKNTEWKSSRHLKYTMCDDIQHYQAVHLKMVKMVNFVLYGVFSTTIKTNYQKQIKFNKLEGIPWQSRD